MATEDTVSVIAKALGESDEVPLTQIAGVVQALGEEHANKLLVETKDIQDKGGMMLPDGSRKRSPGGVFFFLSAAPVGRGQAPNFPGAEAEQAGERRRARADAVSAAPRD